MVSRKISAAAKVIVDLVATLGNGSQRALARELECSQSVISRIVNGQQEPGPEVVAALKAVDATAWKKLTSLMGSDALQADEFTIPVATCLLHGTPDENRDQLTAESVAVSQSVYRPTLYAVKAKHCVPAVDDPSERFRDDDMITIEAATNRFQQNIQMLHGKLCAVVVEGVYGNSITMRRVWSSFNKREESVEAGYVLRFQNRQSTPNQICKGHHA